MSGNTSSVTDSENYVDNEPTLQSSEIIENNVRYAKLDVSNYCKKVSVCLKNGKLKNTSTNAAYVHLENGGKLFDCDIGLDMTEVINILTPRIVANGVIITHHQIKRMNS